MTVDVTVENTPVEVTLDVDPVVIEVDPASIEIIVEPTEILVTVEPAEIVIDIAPQGVPGPLGPAELYDSSTANPVGAPATYLRFERDIDGDTQAIYLGTAT